MFLRSTWCRGKPDSPGIGVASVDRVANQRTATAGKSIHTQCHHHDRSNQDAGEHPAAPSANAALHLIFGLLGAQCAQLSLEAGELRGELLYRDVAFGKSRATA